MRKGRKSLYQYLLAEIEIMKRLKHPAVIHLFEIINDPDAAEIYLGMNLFNLLNVSLVLECCRDGSLMNTEAGIYPIRLRLMKQYIRSIIYGLMYSL
jgi:serine/threonine protein kinase